MSEDEGRRSSEVFSDSCEAFTDGTSVRLETRCNSDFAIADFERLWLRTVLVNHGLSLNNHAVDELELGRVYRCC